MDEDIGKKTFTEISACANCASLENINSDAKGKPVFYCGKIKSKIPFLKIDDTAACSLFSCSSKNDYQTYLAEKEVKDEIARKEIELSLIQQNFILASRQINNILPLLYDDTGVWWRWNTKRLYWTLIKTDTGIMSLINKTVGDNTFENLNPASRNEILKDFQIVSNQAYDTYNMKSKLAESENLIQFKDEIYSVKNRGVSEPSDKNFITNIIPWNIGKSAETPVMDELFKSWVGEDKKQLLYDILYYAALSKQPLHRFFIFLGKGANGKSTYIKIIQKFLGEENITSSSLDGMSNSRFESSKLFKKLAVFISETNFKTLENTEVIKTLTGEDMKSAEFKGKNPFDFKNYAKIIISTNTLPQTMDKTSGFYRRVCLVEFNHSFTQTELKVNIEETIPDIEYENLAYKLTQELPLILALKGFRGEDGEAYREKHYEEKSNPISAFMAQKCLITNNEDDAIPGYLFRDEFRRWCNENGYRNYGEREIALAVASQGLESTTKRITNENGEVKVWRVYPGVVFRLKEQNPIFTESPVKTEPVINDFFNQE
jgi:putative DNA primase/helicase